ncbi:MAG: alpha-glucan family phosphorylase [Candidatus Alcyoniella australis]|nr:alpha-glucan family phosphorylase [Candidatus Alcyoniella australis]
MRVIYDFRVEPALPERLEPLKRLAYNLYWSWHADVVDLFRRIDGDLWESTGHNPVLLLGSVDQRRLEELSTDAAFVESMDEVLSDFDKYMQEQTWFQRDVELTSSPVIAYFSMEYGITECLPMYGGGLGVLAGDHLKSSSDLGLPLVGIGLLYQQGYFMQYLNADGWQQESYPVMDPFNLPIMPAEDQDGKQLTIELSLPGRPLKVRIWKVLVGRIDLYLLDSNVEENLPADRAITAKLYGGDQELRIQQEIVLGIGGLRALHEMGIMPAVCHMNEGHAAFMALERIRLLMRDTGLSFEVAQVAVEGGNVFTSHTPVPAGFDVFPEGLLHKYFGDYVRDVGMSLDELLALGKDVDERGAARFNMAVMAANNAAYLNGVSKLHAKVTREMAKPLYPHVPIEEIPVIAITNGVHVPSWISKDMARLFDQYLSSGWHRDTANPKIWESIDKIPDAELWRVHELRRERLIEFVRRSAREQLERQGASEEDLAQVETLLDPGVLTIGFARRFATYKRADLFLADQARMRAILSNTDMPVQFLIAGKAHPRDEAGKQLIKNIVHYAREEGLHDRIVFIENYNIAVARYMVQGVDVWLNTPRRPMEASGTSGMKVLPNGGLNLSVLDGWWDEAYDSNVGWAIGSGEVYEDPAYQDRVESNTLYDILEKKVVPLFYERGRDGLPKLWIKRMKQSMRQLIPFFNTYRMVMEYAENCYLLAETHRRRLAENDFLAARELAQWKRFVREQWGTVKIEQVEFDPNAVHQIGEYIPVKARVRLGAIKPDNVRVEMYVGPMDHQGRIFNGQAVRLKQHEDLGEGLHLFRDQYRCAASGRHGLGVRVVPFHENLAHRYAMALIEWA